jgi:O-antigen/teichoic acid export membrane protein
VSVEEKTIVGKLKEIGSHSIIYGIGIILQGVLGYILIPLYTKEMDPGLYGTLSLLTLLGTMAGSVFFLGASSALSRSYYDYEKDSDRCKVVGTTLLITLCGAVLQCLIGILFSKEISLMIVGTEKYSQEVIIVLFSSAATFINTLFFSVLRFKRKSIQVVVINLVSLFISTAFIVYFIVYMKYGVMGVVLGTFIGQLLILIMLVICCYEYWDSRFMTNEVAIQLKFGIPTILIGFSYYGLNSVDRFVINKYGSLDDVGIYSLGYKFGIIIYSIFITPFSQIWAPMRMEYRNDKNAKEFFTCVVTYYFIIGIAITVPASVYAYELVSFMSNRIEYVAAYHVVAPIMLAHLIYGAINILDSGIIFERKIMYDAYILTGIVLLSYILNMLMVPHFGYVASAYVLLFCCGCCVFIVWKVSNRFYKIEIEHIRIFATVSLGIIIVWATQYIVVESKFLMILYKGITILFFYLLVYIKILKENERLLLKSKLVALMK